MNLNDTPKLRNLVCALDAALEAVTDEIKMLGPACPLSAGLLGEVFQLKDTVAAELEDVL